MLSFFQRSVKEIDLSDCIVTEDHLHAMTSCKRLKKLYLNQPRQKSRKLERDITADHHLSSLLENCKNLTVLHLRDMTNFVSDEVFKLHQGSMYDISHFM